MIEFAKSLGIAAGIAAFMVAFAVGVVTEPSIIIPMFLFTGLVGVVHFVRTE